MPNLNRVMLMGNLTRDPELRYTPNNTAVTSVGLAVNRRWRNQQGESQEETTFVDCEAWGRQAEVINEYMRKGKPIYIEGRLRLDQWQDRDGNNRSKLKIVVENFQFLDSRAGDGGQRPATPAASAAASTRGGTPESATVSAEPQQPAAEPHQPVDDQDIPF